ncbi:MAG: hypothetical protein F9K13_13300 [Candidatus Methylomirabilis oxygeniifera]|jgi:hypothetical protein|nr:MAG: hypothetical protein F9K13_13300 [Candidatus Methylomirabilis oxyfera]
MGKIVPLHDPKECDPFNDPPDRVAVYLTRAYGYKPDQALAAAEKIQRFPDDFREPFLCYWHGRASDTPLRVKGGHAFRISKLLEQCPNFIEAFFVAYAASDIQFPLDYPSESW